MHEGGIHVALTEINTLSLIDLHSLAAFTLPMKDVGHRIRQRIDEMGTTQAEVSRRTGLSTARLNNYVKGLRPPDVESLVKIAKALRTSTDHLLGLSESSPLDAEAVILRLLELDGMPPERSQVIAQVAAEALRLLSALPDEGDARTRALLAAQAAWQVRPPSTPN